MREEKQTADRLAAYSVVPDETRAVNQPKIKVDMAGDWTANLSYEGPRGSGQTSFNLNTKS